MRRAVYAGLPEEFPSPDHAADRIAALDCGAERLALIERIPAGGWRRWVLHQAKIAIAVRITEMPEKRQRQDALAAVPEDWRADVRGHVLRLWETREIRARYQADLTARREARAAG